MQSLQFVMMLFSPARRLARGCFPSTLRHDALAYPFLKSTVPLPHPDPVVRCGVEADSSNQIVAVVTGEVLAAFTRPGLPPFVFGLIFFAHPYNVASNWKALKRSATIRPEFSLGCT